MKQLRAFFITLFTLTLPAYLLAHSQEYLYKQKPAFYSYIIGDVNGNTIDDEYAADVYATPASTQKVVTALVALKTLGADYRYKTTLSITKKKNVIQDVIISFSGDPTLSSEHLYTLLKPLQNSTILGKIILDASVFQTTPISKNLMIDDLGKWYALPACSMNIDRNIVKVEITPSTLEKKANIMTSVPCLLDNCINTTDDTPNFSVTWQQGVIKATGTINPTTNPVTVKLAPWNIDAYIINKITRVLRSLNITGGVEIVRYAGMVPSNATLINELQSEPLKEMLTPALKKSDNFVFDCIYLTMIHSYTTTPISSWEDGNNIIKSLVKTHFDVDLGDATIVDGSGLSRYNRIQPRALFTLLKKGFTIPEFVNALAQPGEKESTLATRTTLPTTIHAKTGTLTGVSCLCGYNVTTERPKAFVMMTSSFAPPITDLLTVVDTFLSNQFNHAHA